MVMTGHGVLDFIKYHGQPRWLFAHELDEYKPYRAVWSRFKHAGHKRSGIAPLTAIHTQTHSRGSGRFAKGQWYGSDHHVSQALHGTLCCRGLLEVQPPCQDEDSFGLFMKEVAPRMSKSNRLNYGDCLIRSSRSRGNTSVDPRFICDSPFNSGREYNAIYKDETGRPLPDKIEAFCDLLDAGSNDTERAIRVNAIPVA